VRAWIAEFLPAPAPARGILSGIFSLKMNQPMHIISSPPRRRGRHFLLQGIPLRIWDPVAIISVVVLLCWSKLTCQQAGVAIVPAICRYARPERG
jgi:hypothetical protein